MLQCQYKLRMEPIISCYCNPKEKDQLRRIIYIVKKRKFIGEISIIIVIIIIIIIIIVIIIVITILIYQKLELIVPLQQKNYVAFA